MQAAPLFDRPLGAALFRLPEGPDGIIDGARFLADIERLAEALPDRRHVVNLCQERYAFAVGLAACVLRGQVSLLSGDPSAGMLNRLAQEFADAYALVDGAPAASVAALPAALPRHRIAREPSSAAQPRARRIVPTIPMAQPAAIVMTSGTTGGPVGTGKCWGELVARSRAAGARFTLREAAPVTIVGTVPPGHMYGLETTVLLPLHASASVWCGPAFFPADIVASLDALPGPRLLVTTPLHLRALLQTARPARPPERVISATAPLDLAQAERTERDWNTTVLEIFGATELGSIASRRTTKEQEWTLYPGVVLAGPDHSPHIAAPWAEPRPLGDVVERTMDGTRFRLIGRTSDLIKLGGRRASLAGLSRILTGIEGVHDGAFLAPDDAQARAQDRPVARLAAVAVAPSHSEASLLEALRAELDPIFLPRPLVLLDALPRNALGKLPQAALRAALARHPAVAKLGDGGG